MGIYVGLHGGIEGVIFGLGEKGGKCREGSVESSCGEGRNV